MISRLGENGITVLFTQQDVVPLDSSQRQQPESQTPASPCSPSAQHSGAEFEDAASDAASSPDEGADAPTPQAQPLRVRLSSVTLLRFLRARAFQFAAAAKVLEKHVLWRAKVRPEAITSGEIRVPIESGAWTFLGKSKHKRPVLLINAGLWKPEEYPIETYVKFVSFFLTDVERQIDEVHISSYVKRESYALNSAKGSHVRDVQRKPCCVCNFLGRNAFHLKFHLESKLQPGRARGEAAASVFPS